MKVVAIIQARVNSTRLPGKALLPLHGQSVLSHVIERVRQCPLIDQIVVATPDDEIEAEAKACGVSVFRGSESNVLDRTHGAADWAGAGIIVRITSDCPLIDPTLLEEMVFRFQNEHIDYLSNTLERTYPKGLDIEVFSMQALEIAWLEGICQYDREHVTPYIYRSGKFRLRQHKALVDLSAHRWTLDTPQDYLFLKAIFACLGGHVNTRNVIALLSTRPDLVAINAE